MANDTGFLTDNTGQVQLVGTFDSTGYSKAFRVRVDRPINIELTGSGTGFTIRLERQLPGAAAPSPLTAQGSAMCVFSGPVSEKWVETEEHTDVFLNCTVAGTGTLAFRISQ